MANPLNNQPRPGDPIAGSNAYMTAERRLLRELCPPSPPSEQCLARIRRDIAGQRQAAARHQSRWLLMARRPAAAAIVLLLASAGVWSWSGMNSDDLDLATTLRVLRSTNSHSEKNLLAAIGKTGREVISLIGHLESNGVMTPVFKQKCRNAFETPRDRNRPMLDAEALARLKAQPAPLTAAQEKDVLLVFSHCGNALRDIAGHSVNCMTYSGFASGDITTRLQ